MSDTGSDFEMTGILLGQGARRRKASQEKIAIIQQSMESGMPVSPYAPSARYSVRPAVQVEKAVSGGSLTAVAAGEDVVPASKLSAAMKQIRQLQCLPGKKTREVEMLKETVEYGQARQWIAHAPLLPKNQDLAKVSRTLGVSRAQLSLRITRSAQWQDGCCNRRSEAADAALLPRLLTIINDMPGYGYRRVWAILRKQLRNEGLPPVNAKRIYRVMSANNLLLLHNKLHRAQREHNGKVVVAESDQRGCSGGFEFGCDDGEKLRVTLT